jgi:hypothetical protein
VIQSLCSKLNRYCVAYIVDLNTLAVPGSLDKKGEEGSIFYFPKDWHQNITKYRFVFAEIFDYKMDSTLCRIVHGVDFFC